MTYEEKQKAIIRAKRWIQDVIDYHQDVLNGEEPDDTEKAIFEECEVILNALESQIPKKPLVGASDELKNYTKEIIKDCSSIAFGLYRGEIDATTADRTQTLIREARWRLDMLQKRLDTVLAESGVDVVEQMAMDPEKENSLN